VIFDVNHNTLYILNRYKIYSKYCRITS